MHGSVSTQTDSRALNPYTVHLSYLCTAHNRGMSQTLAEFCQKKALTKSNMYFQPLQVPMGPHSGIHVYIARLCHGKRSPPIMHCRRTRVYEKKTSKLNSDIKVLPDIVTESPLFIPNYTVKRTLHIVLVASSRSTSARITNCSSTAHTTAVALAPLPLEPASPALGACSIGIRNDRCSVLASIALDECRVGA